MNYAFLGLPLYYLLKPDVLDSLVAIWLICIFSLVIFPVLLTLLFSWLRRLDVVQRNTPHPSKIVSIITVFEYNQNRLQILSRSYKVLLLLKTRMSDLLSLNKDTKTSIKGAEQSK